VQHKLTPNTYDSKFFYSVARDEAIDKAGLDKSKRYILMVSRLFYQKGLHNLVKIMPELIKRFRDVHLLVIGDFIEGEESYQDEISELIKKLNIQDYVTLKDRVEHHQGLVYFYNSAEVFVLPTLSDSFAAVNIEALACGIPVISTDINEIPYYLKPGLGILVKKNDQKELFDAIIKVLSGNFHMNEEERKKILSNYDYRKAAKSLRDWYLEVLNERRKTIYKIS
jgi:glycosyltransferase involved in cell wall biosynthesis